MKKRTSFILFAAATLALGFMGCSQDETQGGDSNGKTLTFVGSSSSNTEPGAGAKAGTRTNLGNVTTTSNGILYYWTSGDKIWVGATPTQSGEVATAGSNSGTFTVTGATANSGTSYNVLYTGNGSASASNVRIKCVQAQLVTNNSDHIGTDGDCATATAVQDASDNTKYNFKLDHKSAYLMLMPFSSSSYTGYTLQSVQVIADQDVVGTYGFSSAGLGSTPTCAMKYVAVNAGAFGQGTFTIPSSKSESDAVYVVIAPQTVGSLKCIYTIVNGSTIKSIEKTVISSSTELKANTLYRIGANLDVDGTDVSTTTSPGYYQWDATDGKNYLQTYSTNNYYNGTTAQYVCADCPSSGDIQTYYINTTSYWDTAGPSYSVTIPSSKLGTGNTSASQTTNADGTITLTTTNGRWFLKKGHTASTAVSWANVTNKSDYFFLSATGRFDANNGKLTNVGMAGFYWSSTSLMNNNNPTAWYIELSSNRVRRANGVFGYGCRLWSAQ